MAHICKLVGVLALLAAGYALGIAHQSFLPEAQAQKKEDERIPADSIIRIRNSYATLADAQQDLVAAGTHEISLSIVNPLAVGAGGTRSLEDLERGTGVDPFTFGALYAGLANDSIRSEVTFDEQGRLMYRNKVVRLYSPQRMKELFEDYGRIAAGN
ncbi:MAG: hypothetical protein KDA65_00600 [Planctomycetaceae bacterium]|nr:hypothetical protein [Planctomycetaceae bacterium]